MEIYWIVGMFIAIVTTLFNPNVLSYEMIILGIIIGGAIGTYIALKIEMTALPQLVAAFHSLVGLAAVFVATSAFYSPESYGIIDENGRIFSSSLVEMSIGVAIGAITFTGSIIAFLKLQGACEWRANNFFWTTFFKFSHFTFTCHSYSLFYFECRYRYFLDDCYSISSFRYFTYNSNWRC